MVILTAINLLGVKESVRTSDVVTVSKLVPLLLFVCAGLFFVNLSRFGFGSLPTVGTFSSAIFVLIYAFSGFEAVLGYSGQVRQPQRVIPFALVMALVLLLCCFC